MALFDRDRLPFRSALTREPVEALRTLFLDDLLSRPLTPDNQTGCLTDRTSRRWIVFDIDGTREAVRQRALPKGNDLPPKASSVSNWTASAIYPFSLALQS